MPDEFNPSGTLDLADLAHGDLVAFIRPLRCWPQRRSESPQAASPNRGVPRPEALAGSSYSHRVADNDDPTGIYRRARVHEASDAGERRSPRGPGARNG